MRLRAVPCTHQVEIHLTVCLWNADESLQQELLVVPGRKVLMLVSQSNISKIDRPTLSGWQPLSWTAAESASCSLQPAHSAACRYHRKASVGQMIYQDCFNKMSCQKHIYFSHHAWFWFNKSSCSPARFESLCGSIFSCPTCMHACMHENYTCEHSHAWFELCVKHVALTALAESIFLPKIWRNWGKTWKGLVVCDTVGNGVFSGAPFILSMTEAAASFYNLDHACTHAC